MRFSYCARIRAYLTPFKKKKVPYGTGTVPYRSGDIFSVYGTVLYRNSTGTVRALNPFNVNTRIVRTYVDAETPDGDNSIRTYKYVSRNIM